MRKRTTPIIHIIGLPGAGKTTLSQRLSKALKVPVIRIGYYRARFPQTPKGSGVSAGVQRDKFCGVSMIGNFSVT